MPPETSRMSVEDAVTGRQSIRAYLPKPVPLELVGRLLTIAGRAPSGSNIQPWNVVVLTGGAKDALCGELVALHEAGDDGSWPYQYYSDVWREPWLARRRACGWGLYGTLGIPKGDREASRAFQRQNYRFFGAPVGMIFSIDRELALGAWIDYGMFLQSIMVAARSFGLETCAQAAFCVYHDVLHSRLAIPRSEMIVCGMALGYPDPAAVVNSFRTERESVDAFARFLSSEDEINSEQA